MTLDSFKSADIRSLTDTELDDFPFGVIEMDVDGIVTRYNRYESEAAGLKVERVVGTNFFRDVGICLYDDMVTKNFYESENLDITFPFVFTLRMRPTDVTLRLIKDSLGAILLVHRHG